MKQYKAVLKENGYSVLGVVCLNILTALSMVFAGYSLSFLFDAYEYPGNKTKALLLAFGIVLAIWLTAMGIYYLSLLAQSKIQEKIKNDLRRIIGTKIAGMEYGELVNRDCGNFVSWLTNDAEQIYVQSFGALFSGISNLATTIFSFGALVLLGWHIAGAAIILLGVIAVLPQLTGKRLQKANQNRSEAMERSTQCYQDAILGGSVFFLTNLRERMTERIMEASRRAEKTNYQFNRTNATTQILVSTVSLIGQIVLLFVTLFCAIMGVTSAGAVLSVANLAGSFFQGAGSFVKEFLTVRASKPLWQKFQREESRNMMQKKNIQSLPEITLKQVSFRYGDHVVLQNKSLSFRAGGKYAIMGESGCGKSTLTKIILGVLPDYSGEVYYGDIEQRDCDLQSLYRHVAYVEQQIYLFQDTLRFNITLGEPYSQEEIMAVVKQCHLEEYVASLPRGLDTVISENGKNLSGGQRQRIALARGLIRKVDFIILDEGTSALDEANALEIETGLADTPDLGVIIITHHLRETVKEKLTEVYCLTAAAVPEMPLDFGFQG